MGKVRIPKIQRPSTREIYGRVLAGFADTPANEFKAYQMAMGPQNVRHENYVMAIPPIQVQRRPGQWAEPDAGLDVLDFTTDMVPEIPSIAGSAIGGATAGLHGAAGGAIVGNLAKQRIGQSLGLRDNIDPTMAKVEGAMELAGPVLGAIPIPPIMGKTVYHGSPHMFSKFDMSKIGTGEGAQAWGHGLYFADVEDVARNYQPRSGKYEKKLEKLYKQAEDRMDYSAMSAIEAAKMHKSPQQIKALYSEGNGYNPETIKKVHSYVDKHLAPQYQKMDSGMYEVDLPDDKIDMMIDWDKPFNEQSEHVKKALSGFMENKTRQYKELTGGGKVRIESDPDMGDKYFFDIGGKTYRLTKQEAENMTGTAANEGKVIYQTLAEELGSPAKASAKLKEWGIPGIKYMDQFSREMGEGTSNYVVFDDSIPKILTRNGKPLPPDTLDPIPLTKSAGSVAPAPIEKKAPTLSETLDKIRAAGVEVSAYEKGNLPNTIRLSKIVVPAAERGQTKGTQAMRQLMEYADRTGQRVALSPATDFGATSKKRLTEFYKRMGFVENKGRNTDMALSESMYYQPRAGK